LKRRLTRGPRAIVLVLMMCMKVTKHSGKGRDEEENKLETKIAKNANHGAY